MKSVELVASPYTIRLDVECADCCRGSMVRLPDGVEASFNCTDALLVLLEGMTGKRWWQANRAQVEERFLSFAKLRTAN
jgi:hypothetical protein